MASELIHAILLLGAPGTGKGTQGAILGQVPGFVHQSSGDIFRSMDPNSEIGKLFRSYSGEGRVVPSTMSPSESGNRMSTAASPPGHSGRPQTSSSSTASRAHRRKPN
ncbi:MAG: nucleoside monophosphate kinase [Phycisphaerales bacterium]